jgi:putative N6-adenine-specific DNA methylase
VSLPALRWIATCARGLEPVVAGELAALGCAVESTDVGGVAFSGDTAAGLRANWRLRAANRVLLELGSWSAPDELQLYRGSASLVAGGLSGALWDRESLRALFDPARTFAVQATSSRSELRDTRWIALRVKDGIVDAQRSLFGRRSDVDRERPSLQLRLRLHSDRATLLLDTSGEPLDRRGYRVATTAAPAREQLAAAAILASGWDGRGALVDPMCGSGTFLAEGAALALGLPPNRLRERWGFETLPFFSPALWERIRAEPMPALDPELQVFGIDRAAEAIAAARQNLSAAGLAERAQLAIGDAFDFTPPPGPGLVTVNPPYGERLAEPASWRQLGDLLKTRYKGYRAVVLAGDARLGKELGLRPSRRLPVWNGPLEARVLVLDLY